MIYYNLGNDTSKWFSSYLSNWKLLILQPMLTSEINDVDIGVPQGSVLGPPLFIMYVNDLFHIINEEQCKMIMYADDTVIYTSKDSLVDGCNKLDIHFSSVLDWCMINKFTVL